jgi:hypothetical protein
LDQNSKATDAGTRPTFSAKTWLAILLVSLVMTLTFITIPRYPYLIDDALSEKAVLSYAHEHHLQFGTDIVFTYGPLGFLVSRYFFSHAAGARMLTDFATCFATALGVALLAWRSTPIVHFRSSSRRKEAPSSSEATASNKNEPPYVGCYSTKLLSAIWKWLLLAVFVFLASNIDPRADLVLYIGLLSWGLLCFLESGFRLGLSTSIFAALAAFSVLVKANFLVLVALSCLLIVVDLAARGKIWAAIWIVVSLISAFLLGRHAAGQDFSNLKSFFLNSIPIILGYDQTVGLEGLAVLQQRGWITLPLIFAATAIRTLTAFHGTGPQPRLRRFLLFIWTSALIFIIWKHGFVRAGLFHSGFYFGLVPIVALALEAIPSERLKAANWSRALAGVCCLICLLTLVSLFFADFASSLLQPFRAIPPNFSALVNPAEFQRQMLELQKTQLAEADLPRIRKLVGRAPVDVFGQDQLYAIVNDLNYRPRPIFQSYMAYNTPLARMNQQFYFSKASPEYVLFRLTPIDRRYAPLEDGAVLRDLLINYEPVEGENQFVLLKQKVARALPKLTLLREGTARPGEPILLNDSAQADLWMQVTVRPTLLGRARQFFFKPTNVRLAMWRNSSKEGASWFRAPTPMLAAGFVASPMLANTDDTLNLYADSAIVHPYACSIELGVGNQRYWQETIAYRVYKIENRLGHSARESLARLLTYAGFQTIPAEIVSPSNAFVHVESKPAFFLPLGGSIHLNPPIEAKTLEGKFGMGTSNPNVQPADFRIEEQLPDGSVRMLLSRIPNPGDYGLKPFSVSLSSDADRKIILRTAPAKTAETNSANKTEIEKALPLSCWAEVRFK